MKSLGGAMFVKDVLKYDYCVSEAIDCLNELCDQVVICDVGSTDGTYELVSEKAFTIRLPIENWNNGRGKERIADFQNVAASFLETDYYFLLQPDEILHEKSFSAVREAIETDKEAFLCNRINLWRDCNSYLNVPIERQPCNTQVIRLAKTKYKSVGDGESIDAFADDNWLSKIRIYHYGFVRKKEVMKDKVMNMQRNVFEIDHDPKLDQSEVFDWRLWFSNEDLLPIKEQHPKFIQEWIKTRP